MATKNQIIETLVTKVHDPEEPLFLLRGRDPFAPEVVRQWAEIADLNNVNTIKVEEAKDCATRMQEYEPKRKPD